MTNASITRKLFWLERPQKHYADQVRHPGGGHGVRGDGAVRAAHRQLGFGGARAAAGAWAKAGVFFAGAGLLQRRAGPVDAVLQFLLVYLLDTGFILFGTSKLIPNYTLCNQHRGIQAS